MLWLKVGLAGVALIDCSIVDLEKDGFLVGVLSKIVWLKSDLLFAGVAFSTSSPAASATNLDAELELLLMLDGGIILGSGSKS